jgi:hypothetical protein
MNVVHFSGLRLGAAFTDWPRSGEAIRARQRDVLRQVFERSHQAGAQLMICSGDLFDSNAVPITEIDLVAGLCREFTDMVLAVLPGGRDPWAPYSVHRHMSSAGQDNLILLSPEHTSAVAVLPGLWLYGLPEDVSRTEPDMLRELERRTDKGWHIAVAYGDRGRMKPGPEEGLLMVSPDVVGHRFDYLALADGGPQERVGSASKLAGYAGSLVGLQDAGSDYSSPAWLLTLKDGESTLEPFALDVVTHREMQLDVSRLSSTQVIAQSIRREAPRGALVHVKLTGERAANRPILEPQLVSLCGSDLLALQVSDETTLTSPDPDGVNSPLLTALWTSYQETADTQRNELRDAMKLVAAGISDPSVWKEAPWAHS